MARLILLQQARYSVLDTWFRNDLQRVKNTPQIWNAFVTHSLLTKAKAAQAIRFDSDPIVFVEDLGGVDGLFSPGNPEIVSIDEQLIDKFVAAPGDDQFRHRLEATVLHELVHWAWAQARRPERDGRRILEKGEDFEAEAYPGQPIVAEVVRNLDGAPEENLGELSRAYESNGKPGAIGFDKTGGWSYGLYQLATRRGSMASYLGFLARHPEFGGIRANLISVGGDDAATNGETRFQEGWRKLSEQADFARSQHEFIRESYYDPFVLALKGKGVDLGRYHPVLKDVAWSVSVQHGPAKTEIFTRALASLPPGSRSDDISVINAIYTERSDVDRYFSSSSGEVKAAVRDRFQHEAVAALAALVG